MSSIGSPRRSDTLAEMTTVVRAVRGATTVDVDDPAHIRAACSALFRAMLADNDLHHDDLISVVVTTTADLTSIFPAKALREECGLDDVPLLGALEAPIDGGLPKAIRLLVHVNTTKTRAEIRHIFHNNAASLRPDIATGPAPASSSAAPGSSTAAPGSRAPSAPGIAASRIETAP